MDDDAAKKITRRLRRMLDRTNGDLERVEVLSAALAGFSRPVPDYEPTFHHLNAATLRRYEMDRDL